MIEISKYRQTAVVNPTPKGNGENGVDYLPSIGSDMSNMESGSLSNLLDISSDGSPGARLRNHSLGSQSLTKINQINIEPQASTNKKAGAIKHQKSSSFSTLKRAKIEWKKLFR